MSFASGSDSAAQAIRTGHQTVYRELFDSNGRVTSDGLGQLRQAGV